MKNLKKELVGPLNVKKNGNTEIYKSLKDLESNMANSVIYYNDKHSICFNSFGIRRKRSSQMALNCFKFNCTDKVWFWSLGKPISRFVYQISKINYSTWYV